MSGPRTPFAPRRRRVLTLLAGGSAWAALPMSPFSPQAALAAETTVADVSIELSLDPGDRSLLGEARLRPASGSRQAAWLLADRLTLGSVTVGGAHVTPTRTRDGGLVRHVVDLPETGSSVRMQFTGALPPLDAKLDHRGVLGGLGAFASTDGCFLPTGAGWYPIPPGLHTWSLKITTGDGHRAVASGDLLDEARSGGTATARFESRHPSEGIDLVTGPYEVEERWFSVGSGKRIRVRTCFHAPIAAEAEGYLSAAAAYLERYSKRIGAYPHAGFTVASSPLPTGFGMAAMTWLGVDVLKLPFIRQTSLGHEVLHNWWGNGVYVDASTGNWSEGLTTYMADYAYKAEKDPADARAMRLGWLRDFAALPAGAEKPLASFRSRRHAASASVGYGKSAMLFHMLENEVGAEAFSAALRGFWEAWKFREASFDDLRRAFESVVKRDLSGFFRQWLTRTRAPEIQIAKASAKGTTLELEVAQRLSSPADDAYLMPLPLRIRDENGVSDQVVKLEAKRQRIVLELPAPAVSLQIDPDFTLWRVLAPSEAPPILRQFEVATDARLLVLDERASVRSAAEALATRLAEKPPRSGKSTDLGRQSMALMLVGTHAQVDAAMAQSGRAPRPQPLLSDDTTAVWMAPEAGKPPLLVVSLPATDAEARLQTLARRLPHMGSSSWVQLPAKGPLQRGLWPAISPDWPLGPKR